MKKLFLLLAIINIMMTSCQYIGTNENEKVVKDQEGNTENTITTQGDWENYSKITAILYIFKNGNWKPSYEPNNNSDIGESYDEYRARLEEFGPEKINNVNVQRKKIGSETEYRVYWNGNYYPVSESPVKSFKYCFYYKSGPYCFNM